MRRRREPVDHLSDEARALRALALLHESINERPTGRQEASEDADDADRGSGVSGPALTA